jgi:hypothetical protein
MYFSLVEVVPLSLHNISFNAQEGNILLKSKCPHKQCSMCGGICSSEFSGFYNPLLVKDAYGLFSFSSWKVSQQFQADLSCTPVESRSLKSKRTIIVWRNLTSIR